MLLSLCTACFLPHFVPPRANSSVSRDSQTSFTSGEGGRVTETKKAEKLRERRNSKDSLRRRFISDLGYFLPIPEGAIFRRENGTADSRSETTRSWKRSLFNSPGVDEPAIDQRASNRSNSSDWPSATSSLRNEKPPSPPPTGRSNRRSTKGTNDSAEQSKLHFLKIPYRAPCFLAHLAGLMEQV